MIPTAAKLLIQEPRFRHVVLVSELLGVPSSRAAVAIPIAVASTGNLALGFRWDVPDVENVS